MISKPIPPELQSVMMPNMARIVDKLIKEFLPQQCDGENDLVVVGAFLTTAAIMIAGHCDMTGQSFDTNADASRKLFDGALALARK